MGGAPAVCARRLERGVAADLSAGPPRNTPRHPTPSTLRQDAAPPGRTALRAERRHRAPRSASCPASGHDPVSRDASLDGSPLRGPPEAVRPPRQHLSDHPVGRVARGIVEDPPNRCASRRLPATDDPPRDRIRHVTDTPASEAGSRPRPTLPAQWRTHVNVITAGGRRPVTSVLVKLTAAAIVAALAGPAGTAAVAHADPARARARPC